ncbi:unnamed protein product [Taenia asiatica]|uniref:Uncharacterized protein n=1 Tax=Taenia asiatica TaxID=60517 RepID=A0A0R3VX56_TAEAS|nr:unnamed protein product [Taenia asiatica]
MRGVDEWHCKPPCQGLFVQSLFLRDKISTSFGWTLTYRYSLLTQIAPRILGSAQGVVLNLMAPIRRYCYADLMRKRETDKQVNNKSHGQIGTGGSTIGEALAATQMTLSNSRQNSTGDDEVWRKTSQTGNAKYYEQFAALYEFAGIRDGKGVGITSISNDHPKLKFHIVITGRSKPRVDNFKVPSTHADHNTLLLLPLLLLHLLLLSLLLMAYRS